MATCATDGLSQALSVSSTLRYLNIDGQRFFWTTLVVSTNVDYTAIYDIFLEISSDLRALPTFPGRPSESMHAREKVGYYTN